MKLTHIDLFSGIGGFALAARWAGIETVQFVEIDKFCQKVLQKNFPGVPIHDDIKTFTYAECNRFNGQTIPIQSRESQQESSLPTGCNQRPFLLTGGFPCQPFSCAGKRRGKEDDRYLWEEMLRVIKEFKPTWIIGENVNGIRSMEFQDSLSELEGDTSFQEDTNGDYTNVLDGICDSLEAIGYEVQPLIIPACAVNAPHRRDRVWIVANRTRKLLDGSGNAWRRGNEHSNTDSHAPDTQSQQTQPTKQRGLHAKPCGKDSDVTDTSNQGLQGGERPGTHDKGQAALGSTPERNHAWSEPWLKAATRLCRVDDGLPRQVDRVNRLKALGNAVVPQIPFLIMTGILDLYTVGQPLRRTHVL